MDFGESFGGFSLVGGVEGTEKLGSWQAEELGYRADSFLSHSGILGVTFQVRTLLPAYYPA